MLTAKNVAKKPTQNCEGRLFPIQERRMDGADPERPMLIFLMCRVCLVYDTVKLQRYSAHPPVLASLVAH
jgi:hypothetical protein